MSTLSGAKAVVTGASSGIGAAIAGALLDRGASVVGMARRADRLKGLARDGRFHAVPCDLRDTEAIVAAFADARERLGGIDILVNAAGLGRRASLLDGSTEDWREMLEVNVLALCVCTREAITDMRRRNVAGHVLHIASMASHRVPQESGLYSGTKFAVRSLTEGLRRELRELGSPIRVSAISPGFVETEFAEVYAHGDRSAADRTYSAYPCLQAKDIAATAIHVLEAPPHVQIHDVLVRPTQQPD